MLGKRPFSEIDQGGVPVNIKLMCPIERTGPVIGRGGDVIKAIRTETTARIKVEDVIPGLQDRVILISSPDRPGAGTCPAQDALQRLLSRVVEVEGPDGKPIIPKRAEISIIVDRAFVGAILGIRPPQDTTIAVVNVQRSPLVAPEEQIIRVAGPYLSVKTGVQQVVGKMRECLQRGVLPTVLQGGAAALIANKPMAGGMGMGMGQMARPGPMPMMPNGAAWGGMPMPPTPPGMGGPMGMQGGGPMSMMMRAGMQPGMQAPAMGGAGPTPSFQMETVYRLLMPDYRVGGLIGKQGEHLRRIRTQTNADVHVDAKNEGTDLRLVTCRSNELCDAQGCGAAEALMRCVQFYMSEKPIDGVEASSHTIRIVTAAKQMGAVIGVKGATIRQVAADTKAKLTVDKEKLPNGLSPGNDEVLLVEGPMQAVLAAVRTVTILLRGIQIKQHAEAKGLPAPATVAAMGVGSIPGAGGVPPPRPPFPPPPRPPGMMPMQPGVAAPPPMMGGMQQQSMMSPTNRFGGAPGPMSGGQSPQVGQPKPPVPPAKPPMAPPPGPGPAGYPGGQPGYPQAPAGAGGYAYGQQAGVPKPVAPPAPPAMPPPQSYGAQQQGGAQGLQAGGQNQAAAWYQQQQQAAQAPQQQATGAAASQAAQTAAWQQYQQQQQAAQAQAPQQQQQQAQYGAYGQTGQAMTGQQPAAAAPTSAAASAAYPYNYSAQPQQQTGYTSAAYGQASNTYSAAAPASTAQPATNGAEAAYDPTAAAYAAYYGAAATGQYGTAAGTATAANPYGAATGGAAATGATTSNAAPGQSLAGSYGAAGTAATPDASTQAYAAYNQLAAAYYQQPGAAQPQATAAGGQAAQTAAWQQYQAAAAQPAGQYGAAQTQASGATAAGGYSYPAAQQQHQGQQPQSYSYSAAPVPAGSTAPAAGQSMMGNYAQSYGR